MADLTAPLQFKEAADFYKKKLQLPSASWTDIKNEQHSHAFVVAGAATDSLVEDFYNAIQQAKTTGGGYSDFQNQFNEIVKKHGWAFNGGASWRSKIIYDTNITQSYNAGRYKQMVAVKDLRPYWEYQHTSIEHPRLSHLSWDGLILSADDAFWDTHMPQNGWGCKCRVNSLTRSGAKNKWESQGKTSADIAPPIEWEDKLVGKNGNNPQVWRVPKGIDPGFAYNPGKAWLDPYTPTPTGYEATKYKIDKKPPKVFNYHDIIYPTTVSISIKNLPTIDPVVAISDYLDIFGATLEKGIVMQDVTGSSIAISKALFIDGADKSSNNFKWLSDDKKIERLEYLNLLALALLKPDEVWWNWERDLNDIGKWRLKKRYLKSFFIEDENHYAITVFTWVNNTWQGSTTFLQLDSNHEKRLKYFASQRIGRLVYRRK